MGRETRTLVDALRTIPRREGRGFTFVEGATERRFYSYQELHDEALRRAAFFDAAGLRKGDRVALVIPEGNEFVLSFLGAVMGGLVPVPIYPRATFKALDGYQGIVRHIVETSRAAALLTVDRLSPHLAPAVASSADDESSSVRVLTCEEFFAGEAKTFAPPAIDEDDLCFLQFTSGSTSRPKGVEVRHRNLVANAQAFLGSEGLDRNDDDVGVSWLPLFHDMGLIGFILGTLICDIPVVILPTSRFARTPRMWLELISEYRGTITFAPNFGYNLALKRLRDKDIGSLDLSSLRVAGCGAEPIRGRTLLEFAERLRPAGFREEAFLPSYGMAEATLAITFHDLGKPLRIDRLDPEEMRQGRATPSRASDALEVVGCGRGFSGHEIQIVDGDGQPLPDRRVGEVLVRGPSTTAGYFENPEATAAAFDDGWLRTGDLAYRADGDLFICGRSKDLIIIHGANHYPQDIEWAVSDLEGVRRDNVVAFSVDTNEGEALVVVAEAHSSDAPRLRREITQRVSERFGLQPRAELCRVGTLPKTSSGKAQRRKSKQLFEAGELPLHREDA
ncbi:MAG: fatty acyl-AMP ligase [Myxococcota bacterium]